MTENRPTGALLKPHPEGIAALIAHHCYKDEEFRRQFLISPQEAIMDKAKTLAGKDQIQWPKELKIVSHANDDCTWHIPLPPKDQVWELSTKELQKIASGETILFQFGVSAGVFGISTVIAGIIGVGIVSAATGAIIGAVAAK